jgi:hypothetical protein
MTRSFVYRPAVPSGAVRRDPSPFPSKIRSIAGQSNVLARTADVCGVDDWHPGVWVFKTDSPALLTGYDAPFTGVVAAHLPRWPWRASTAVSDVQPTWAVV